jgi:AcrR family transcriptional regulator
MGKSNKDNIITNSISLFALKGFDKTSIQAIADKSGLAQTSVLYHFKNKASLFEACLDYVVLNNRSSVNEEDFAKADPFGKLILRLDANAKWALDCPEQAGVLMLLFSFASTDTALKKNATNILDAGRELAINHLREIHEDNPLNSNLSLERLSEIIQQYVNAVIFQILCRDDAQNVYEKFKSDLNHTVNALLYLK